MAYCITEDCTSCGSCESECPVEAISEGEDLYVIDGNLCIECKGHFDEAQCVEACPVEAIEKC
ncbi:MAG: ferredoxin [Bacteroidetes bacterium 4572_112]|nr:MAG: ferredoxin [Bacteroidetes bacterium 4572_112]